MNPDNIHDAARLLAYQQYQAHAATRAIFIPTPTQGSIFNRHISANRVQLEEERAILQRRLRVSSSLHPEEVIHLRRRIDLLTDELDRTSVRVARENNPFLDDTSTKDPDPIPLHLLLEANGVMYGSRGLHIENQYSDYDFAFSYEEHKRLFHTLMRLGIPKSDSTSYFSSVPEAGYHTFFQYKALDPVSNEEVKVDILFLHNDEDLDVIRSSIQDLQSIPQYMLYNKKFRIDAYNKALQHRGWKEFTMSPTLDTRSYIAHSHATVIRGAEDARLERVVRVSS